MDVTLWILLGVALGVLGTFAFAALYRRRLANQIRRGRNVVPLGAVWGERAGATRGTTLAGAPRLAEDAGGGGTCVILRYHPAYAAYCCDANGQNCFYVVK